MSRINSLLAGVALAGTIAALAIPDAPASDEVRGYVETVVDGDSLKLDGNRRVRLHGIDAVELHQTCPLPGAPLVSDAKWNCGHAAWRKLYDMVEDDRWVQCTVKDRDYYGRPVAVCSNRGGDLGRRLVASGYALAFRKYSDAYVDEEEAARAEKLGIHSGGFVEPSQWRRGVR